ncbi:hypothetical protein BBO99_00006969 [Phytophthora kernoviae]|uniref:Major facilitator superfamily (MFS) profile domain-containing protein n=2 Tax=Phytophthora kernoviae TaxID=325452 RepID=A0A3R7K6K1_9STRA|nr:hypothetical protein G195_007816 [Phytophthora kernoviae 00238/432]KAG2520798.1 hypothetical protein JM16_006569 [Phytophthora kernoviae]KAG2521730.1 hypothetical protein JM18_006388 [Phytophthora kernoviae]RLN26307.1 hypothetical protein BBI17_006962 [Phytophthora kernoviae]RLN77185.1 hypothetical protein BBO99_00006969 [Phytophthora kernoviae]
MNNKASPIGTQVMPQERESLLSTDASSVASEATDLLIDPIFKDHKKTSGYGATPTVTLTETDNVIVSDQILVSAIANLSTAYNLAVINYAMMMLDRTYPNYSPALRSTVDSCSLLGAIVGQLTFGYVGTVMGRRKGMIFTLLLSILGAVATASAVESSDDELKKSKAVAAVFSFQGVGQLLAPLMAFIMLCMNAQRTIGWRVLLLVGAFPGLFVLRRAFELKEDEPTPTLSPRILDKQEEESCRSELWEKLRASPSMQRRLFGACASWFLFDLTFYGNVIFTPTILQDTYGLDKHHFSDVALCSLVVAAIALPGNLLTVFIVGKLSFKTIQIMGFVAMALLFLALGFFYEQLLDYRGLLLGMYALTFFFSNFGPNVGTFCLPAEIFGEDVRVELNGVAAASGKLGAAFGAASFGIIEARYGVSYLLALSATVSLLGALVTYKFIPTKHYHT